MVDGSTKIFANWESTSIIHEKETTYFKSDFSKSINVGKFYLLPKIHKNWNKVPGRPGTSNCGMAKEKNSEFLHHHLQTLMKQGELFIKDTGGFLKKL